MPDSDRLQELRRQRALVQEQLVWLDREIAALAAPATAPSQVSVTVPVVLFRAPTVAAASAAPRVQLPAEAMDTEALIAQFTVEERGGAPITKRGCWLAFAGAMLVLLLLVAGLAHFFYR